jgi:hypothetical protein
MQTDANGRTDTRTDVASLEQMITMGQEAAKNIDQGRYLIGGLACLIETHYGANDIKQFATKINVDEKRVREYRTVYKYYDLSHRQNFLEDHPNVCYSQLRDAMRLKSVDESLHWLETVSDNEWTVEQARLELAKCLGKNPPTTARKTFTADGLIVAKDGRVLLTMFGSGPEDLAKLVASHRTDPEYCIQIVVTYRTEPQENLAT